MMDSEAEFQAIKPNPVSSIGRVSGELGISQSSVVHHLDIGKKFWSSKVFPHLTKMSKTIDSHE